SAGVRLGVLDVDPEHLDAERAVPRPDSLDDRRFFTAHLAPRRLKAHEQGVLADQRARVERAGAVEELDLEARRRGGREGRNRAKQQGERRQKPTHRHSIIPACASSSTNCGATSTATFASTATPACCTPPTRRCTRWSRS